MARSTTTTKKRTAPSQAHTKSKKIIIEKDSKPAPEPKQKQRRAAPVTRTFDDEEADSEDEFEDEGGMDFDDDDDEHGVDEPMQVDPRPSKDPNATRESHRAQRELLSQRRAAKPHSSLLADAKRVWALARQKTLPPAERKRHVADLMTVIRGHVQEIVLKHDASRIVQTVVKYGGQAERDEVAKELKGKYRELAQSKYSKFLVTKLIRLCPTHRAAILQEFHGHTPRLLLHREASGVLADAFELYANAYERALLLRDFYGKEVQLFSVTAGSDAEKEQTKKGLKGILDGVDTERKRRVMSSVKENLDTVFNNPDKGAVTHAIVHRVLWEYLQAINDIQDEAEQEKLRREIFENCQDVLAEMVHTRDGSRVVREFLAQGTAKDRKHIVKAIKPHIERMCQSDEAQLVLFSALDIIDDTKLTGKSLLSDLTGQAPSLIKTAQGRRALLYPLVGRAKRHFTPALVASLAETDPVRVKTSKKDASARADEVRRAASEGLLAWVEKEGAEAVRETAGSLVVLDVLLYAEGDKTKAMDALLSPAAACYPSEDTSTPHPLDLPHTARAYKTLLQGGHFSHSSKSIERSPHFDPGVFAAAWVRTVGREVTLASATGNGAFVVAELCACILREGSEETKNEAKGWFAGQAREDIAAWEGRGKDVLLEKVDALLGVA